MSAEDMFAIRNLAARLALAADDGDVATYASLFAPDAVWEFNMPRLTTRVEGAEIGVKFAERVASGFQGPTTGQVHSITTHAIDIAGDRATGRAYMVVHTQKNGEMKPHQLAYYEDEYVKRDGKWLLKHRIVRPAGC